MTDTLTGVAVAPAAPSILAQAQTALVTLWDKIKAAFATAETEVAVYLTKEEGQILALIQPLFAAAEAAAIQDLVQFVQGVVTSAENPGSMDLADWETAILNGLQKVGGDLETLAKSLGSNVLQALIGLVLAALAKT